MTRLPLADYVEVPIGAPKVDGGLLGGNSPLAPTSRAHAPNRSFAACSRNASRRWASAACSTRSSSLRFTTRGAIHTARAYMYAIRPAPRTAQRRRERSRRGSKNRIAKSIRRISIVTKSAQSRASSRASNHQMPVTMANCNGTKDSQTPPSSFRHTPRPRYAATAAGAQRRRGVS